MDLKITPSGQTIVKPTALGPVANTDTKLLIYGLFQKGRVLAQDADGRRAYYDQVPIARSTSRPDGLWNTRRSNSGTTASRWSKMSAWIAS